MKGHDSAHGLKALCALGAVVAFGLMGCESLRTSALPEAPLWLHHPGGALSISLRRQLTASTRKQGEDYEKGQPEIDSVHRRVFVGSSDQGMYALRVEDASTIWRFETLSAVQCEPLYDRVEDVLYFGSNDGALYKVRASDGKLLWRAASDGEISRRPVLKEDVLYYISANETVYAVNAKTGETKWVQHRNPAYGMMVGGHAGLVAGRDKLYAAFSDGMVMAYDLDDGSEQWDGADLAAEAELTAGGEALKHLDTDTTPVLDRLSSGDVVYAGSYAGGVFALDAETGARVWANEHPTGTASLLLWKESPHTNEEGREIPERKILLASSGLTGLWALSTEDGRTLWHRDLPEGGMTAPVPYQGTLLVGTTRYGMFLFSPLDGAVIDGIDPAGGISMTPATYGVRGFVLSNAGVLIRLHIDAPRTSKPAP